jgi:hypothetical protein
MSEDIQMSKLKELYDELWSDAKNLIQDMAGSVSLYKYSSLLLLALNAYPIYWICMYLLVIPSQFLNNWIIIMILSYLVAIMILTYFGFKLLRLYLRLKKRYSKLMKMRLELED